MDEDLVARVRSAVIGGTASFPGPFGRRPLVYADYTASGRALAFIEDYLRASVLPTYANTHTEASFTGLQTTSLREEARGIIARSVGATDEHAVVFCGSGATYAIAKLVGVLGLAAPSAFADRIAFTGLPAGERPVIFVGPYEHHSNELPWRESVADVVTIEEDADGHVSLEGLEAALVRHSDRPLLIGSFSAASNVTGILTDVAAVAALLHRYGALSFWDYAAAAPYVDIDMGSGDDESYLDAVFLSPHKLVGGPGTPGVLVARRELFSNRVPVVPGGGTVAYVSADAHDYLEAIEPREEGGTPDIIGAIRAGLAFQLKDAVGVDRIRDLEDGFVRRAIASWETNPNLMVLGNHTADRLSIVSFVVRSGNRYLHHNFVVALLNDLFGIQSRGGCSCAGPYGHRLLGIDLDTSHAFQREVNRGCEGIKPGWTRLSFNYFIDEDTFAYLVDAVHFVAAFGHRFLPWYRFEPDTGMWRHVAGVEDPPVRLGDRSYDTPEASISAAPLVPTDQLRRYLANAEQLCDASSPTACAVSATTDDFELLRWFPYPNEWAEDTDDTVRR